MAETSTGTNTETTEKVQKVGNGLYHKRHTERLGCVE